MGLKNTRFECLLELFGGSGEKGWYDFVCLELFEFFIRKGGGDGRRLSFSAFVVCSTLIVGGG